MLLVAALLLGGATWAGTVEDARYLHWTGQDEAAAAALEPWLAEHPQDLDAHALYIEIRVRGMGESDVVSAEYRAWSAPDEDTRAAALGALDRALAGDAAAIPEHPLPPILNRRWVNYLLKKWKDDPASLRASVEELWGLDAPIGEDADRLRKDVLALVAEKSKVDDQMWLETSRAVTTAADVPGLATVALQRLVALDPSAWPGALDDAAVRKVHKAAQAISLEVALARLEKLTIPEDARDAEQLRHTLRAEILGALGRSSDALVAREKAWEADPDDPTAARLFVQAAIEAEAAIDAASRALRAGISGAETGTEDHAYADLLWPDAYTLEFADRRVALGRLDTLRRRLDRLTGTQTPAAPIPGATADAAHHLARGTASEDRVGIRHLVQAVRLARIEGNMDVEGRARAELEKRNAWFLAGLDARVTGWDAALGMPSHLRPTPGPRYGASLEGQPLTDFELRLGDKASRLADLEGIRVLAVFTPQCESCVPFLRDFDALARTWSRGGRFIAIDTSGDARSVDRMMEGADLAFEVAKTSGDLPNDILDGGVPRIYVVSPEGVVVSDSGPEPTPLVVREAIADAVAEIALIPSGNDSPASVRRVGPVYPSAAHWMGTPAASCVAQVTVTPDGKPAHIRVEDCQEPFVRATRAALERWQWQTTDYTSLAMVAVDFPNEAPRRPNLPPAECLWASTVDQDGAHRDVFTNCADGSVRPGPLPWSEAARTRSTSVGSPGGSVVIHNVDLPVACEVVIDVGPKNIDLANDPGECPASVIADAAERVRRWDWDVGIGRRTPVRVILRFDPPHR